MNYAKIENEVCVNAIVCDDATLASTLGYTVELADGFGIGDYYRNGVWEKQTYPEPDPEPEPEPIPYSLSYNDKVLLSLIS